MPVARISGKTASDWLDDVLAQFPDKGLTRESARLVAPEEVPEPYAHLLVHRHHMTVTLEEHYGRPMSLEVLSVRHEGDDYARRLVLRAGEGGPIVMAGILRFWLQHVEPSVREEIVSRRTPLGRILIENRVLRRIETVAFLEVDLQSPFARVFGRGPSSAPGHTFGRIATIFCNEEPAVELLEIVEPQVEKPPSSGRDADDDR